MPKLFSADDESIRHIHDQLTKSATTRIKTAPELTREQLAAIAETMFWASLRREEGRPVRVCAVVLAPDSRYRSNATAFAEPVKCTESEIARLAFAAPPSGCLLVSPGDNPTIWGFGPDRPGSWLGTVTFEVAEPGTVRVDVGHFQPFAILDGRSNPVIAGSPHDLPVFFQRALRKQPRDGSLLEHSATFRESFALPELARLVVAEGHGGTILIVPDEKKTTSLEFAYRFATPDKRIPDIIRQEMRDTHELGLVMEKIAAAAIPEDIKNLAIGAMREDPRGGFRAALRATASLCGVDGAVVLTPDLEVIGFGAKIDVSGADASEVVLVTGDEAKGVIPLQEVGGTRHQSAARFVAANKDAVALVISQDRHLSVMVWDKAINMVAVYRNTEWWV